MFLLFGRGGRHGRKFLAARIALLAAFLIVVFALHPHGTELDVIKVVRVVLVVALLGTAWALRRRERSAAAED